jgi:catechol 2,3-dioxygenase
LARVLQKLLELGVPIGSADHGVSDAIYLSDPEGNGIELYADRPPEAWPHRGPDGQVTMYTEALDLSAVLALAHQRGPILRLPRASAMFHLSVADLGHAERFYGEALGFTVTQRSYPGALFLGRDGYHHHVGANIWRSRQAAVPGTLGLSSSPCVCRSARSLQGITKRLADAGRLREASGDVATARDLDERWCGSSTTVGGFENPPLLGYERRTIRPGSLRAT